MSSTPISRRRALTGLALLPAVAAFGAPSAARAVEASVIEARTDRALRILFDSVRGSRDLAGRAKGILIMPEITKAGLLIGGSYGEGALRINGATVGYWSVAAASFGLQAGVQTTAQALFFMTTNSLERFRRSDGWELGADAEFTVPKDGVNVSLNTTVTNKPVIAMTFGQDGFMAGVSLEGAKYSPIVR